MLGSDARSGLGALLDAMGGGEPPVVDLVRRAPGRPALEDPEGVTRAEVRRLLAGVSGAGAAIAVGVGSRGIAGLATVVAATIDELRRAGFAPFVVPAMGSHGGATPEGQIAVLAGYGVTAAALGVPVRATMDTVVIGEVDGVAVHVDRHVAEAGRALLVCRVKPHTDFRGTIESGPTKMAAIGLGKQRGAQGIHALGVRGLRDVMPRIGRAVVERLVLGAVAVVENDSDETASITALGAGEIGGPAETALLAEARANLPRIPFDRLDVLVVDRMGKDVSGSGMDPNVVGRWMVSGLPEPEPDAPRCVSVLDLTDASHGNAAGVGLADFTTRRLAERIDPVVTTGNVLTAGWAALQRGRLPMVLDTDRDAVRAAIVGSGHAHGGPLRLAWISDTLHTGTVAVSEALWDEARRRPDLALAGSPFALPFDPEGTLTPLRSVAGEPW
ncbi:MAG: DUF2088 domain-containing protein [Actinomycetota bacterium]|nr:DUF2088 domain-containing protein [Actinomycetota bacterium]